MQPHRIVSDKTLIASPTAALPVKTKSGSFGSRVVEECIVMGFPAPLTVGSFLSVELKGNAFIVRLARNVEMT